MIHFLSNYFPDYNLLSCAGYWDTSGNHCSCKYICLHSTDTELCSSWELTFLLMLTFPLVFISFRLNNKLYSSTGSVKIDTLQESAHVITETIDHIKTVVTLGAKEYFVNYIKRYLRSHSWYVASNIHYPLKLYIFTTWLQW